MGDTPERIQIGNRSFRVFIDEASLQQRVRELGAALRTDYAGKQPFFLLILKGSLIFGADLVRAFGAPCEIGFVRLKSYEGTTSTGQVRGGRFEEKLSGKDIVVVEDIIDSGLTMQQLLNDLHEQHPASVRVVSLFVKPDAICHQVPVDYRGFDIPNAFIIGYGLDLDEQGRNLRQVYQLIP